jgi:hypothetical protein
MHDVISETTSSEAKQFDFLEGEWNAICRFPLLDGSWGEGPGSLTARNSWMAAFPWNSSRDPLKELRSRASVSARLTWSRMAERSAHWGESSLHGWRKNLDQTLGD